ncbi:MAG: hypothetical protein H7A23_11120 [Leptospiraceae bacterium]|nr:hypothetical protein [Leptospiraceae bacterium]MCP5495095.1 hypothetical protein [Leptospiraceae bacterium]
MKLIFIIFIFFFLHCGNSGPTKETKLFWLYMLCGGSKESTRIEPEYTDLKNGMILYTSKYINHSANICVGDYVPEVLDSVHHVYYKKCVQGQVYREEQNDCKGTGDASNYYGAEKFPFCDTNDSSCQSDSNEADPFLSPAAQTCYYDGFQGKTWKMFDGNQNAAYYEDSYTELLIDYIPRETFQELFPDLPIGDSVYYWDLNSASSTTAYRYTINSSGELSYDKENNTSSYYVICVSEED